MSVQVTCTFRGGIAKCNITCVASRAVYLGAVSLTAGLSHGCFDNVLHSSTLSAFNCSQPSRSSSVSALDLQVMQVLGVNLGAGLVHHKRLMFAGSPQHLNTSAPLHLSTSPFITSPSQHLHLTMSPPLPLTTSPALPLTTSPFTPPPNPLITSPPLHLNTSPPHHLNTSPPHHLSVAEERHNGERNSDQTVNKQNLDRLMECWVVGQQSERRLDSSNSIRWGGGRGDRGGGGGVRVYGTFARRLVVPEKSLPPKGRQC